MHLICGRAPTILRNGSGVTVFSFPHALQKACLRKLKPGQIQYLSRGTQPAVDTGDSGIQAAGNRQMQCVPCSQGGWRFDEHRCGTKVRRFNFYRNEVHGCKSLKIGNGLLACLGVNGTCTLFDAADAGHFSQGPGRNHQPLFPVAFEPSDKIGRAGLSKKNCTQHRSIEVDHNISRSRISATVRPGIGGADTQLRKSDQSKPPDHGSGTRRATGFPRRVMTIPWPASTSASKADKCDLASATVAVFIIHTSRNGQFKGHFFPSWSFYKEISRHDDHG